MSWVKEFKVWDKRLGCEVEGKWGIERVGNKIVIYDDNIAVFYGFSTVMPWKMEIKFCKKTLKATVEGTAFNNTGMYFYTYETTKMIKKTPENIEKLMELINLLENMPEECCETTCGQCFHFEKAGRNTRTGGWYYICAEGKTPKHCSYAFSNVVNQILRLFKL